MKRVSTMPTDKPFAVIWEFGGNIWSNTFIFAGCDEEGFPYYDPFNIGEDSYDGERRGLAFFTSYPHKIFIMDDEDE